MLRRSALALGTLVKLGRGAGSVTEANSNSLLESLQSHGYCYIQHPFIQKSILDQLHRDSRIFFEQYILSNANNNNNNNNNDNAMGGKRLITSSGVQRHNYNCSPLSQFELESIKAPHGFRGYYRYVGASGLDDAIDCFSIGREDVADPAVLRQRYYQQAGWEEAEYLSVISRRNPWDVLLNHVNVTAGGAAGKDGSPSSNSLAPEGLNNNFMSDFRDMLVAYYDLCAAVSEDVLRHISCGLGIRPSLPTGGAAGGDDYDLEFFTAFHQKRDCDLQAKYYPALGSATRVKNGVEIQDQRSSSNPKGVKVLRRKGAKTTPLSSDGDAGDAAAAQPTVRLDTHKDLSTITLLSQDSMGGLQVWDSDKQEYISVPVLEDSLLVNAGVFLEKWTGGLIEATPHRVVNKPSAAGTSRCSIVFFALPDHDAFIEPLLQQDDNPATDGQEGFLAGDLMPSI